MEEGKQDVKESCKKCKVIKTEKNVHETLNLNKIQTQIFSCQLSPEDSRSHFCFIVSLTLDPNHPLSRKRDTSSQRQEDTSLGHPSPDRGHTGEVPGQTFPGMDPRGMTSTRACFTGTRAGCPHRGQSPSRDSLCLQTPRHPQHSLPVCLLSSLMTPLQQVQSQR